LTIFQP